MPCIAGANGSTLRVEQPLPHGLPRPPVLDFVAVGSDVLVAVESKCTGYLSKHYGEFMPAYWRLTVPLGWSDQALRNVLCDPLELASKLDLTFGTGWDAHRSIKDC
jgi:hypothetical protein